MCFGKDFAPGGVSAQELFEAVAEGVRSIGPMHAPLIEDVTQVTSATSVTVSTSVTAANGSSVSFVGYPEVLVKLNFGYHSYYNATQIA